jgi:hypothetical protein
MSDLLNKASLVVIPSGYKEDTVYSVVPSDGSGDLSFTRASNGTRVNSAGLVEVTPWNLVEQSETFDTSPWNKSAGTTLTSGQTDPNGGTTAFRMQMSSASNYISSGIYTVVSGSIYTYTIYIKSNTGSNQSFRIVDGVRGVAGGVLNGTATTSWQRFEVQITPNSTSGAFQLDNTGGTYSNDLLIAFSQANLGSTAKPYFPTTDRLNVPRLTYQNGGGGCPSLLLEKQSTNYFPYSQSVADWYEPDDGVTLTSNTTDTVSPDGTYNASKITIVGGSQRNYQITNSVSGVGTFSAYVKAGTSSTLALYTSSASLLIGYNLSTLAVTQTTGTGTMTSVGNGWYRITATNTLGANEVLQVLYTGNANETIYIWGFQVEASSYPTSYIPTTSASATRVADVATKTGISSLIGQTEGVLFADVDFKANTGEVGIIIEVNSGASNQRVLIYYSSTTILCFANAGVFSYSQNTSERLKIAFAYKSGDSALYVNGVQKAVSSSSLTYSGLSQLNIGSNYAFGQPTNSPTNQAALFKTRLTNAELASLTTI